MSSFSRSFRPLASAVRAALPRVASRSTTAGARLAAPAKSNSFLAATGANRAFGVSAIRFGHGQVDDDLAKQLGAEIEHETAEAESNPDDAKFIDRFLSTTDWKIDAKTGSDEIHMTRTFGPEKIRATFSISDINNTDETEQIEGQEDQEGDENEVTFPVHAIITTEKADKGALNFEVEIHDGEVLISSVVHYSTPELAYGRDSETDWQSRGLYSGPVFEELEEDLQSTFSEYLEERGIDTAFAIFVARFIEHKEQKEYVNWLQKVQEYIKA